VVTGSRFGEGHSDGGSIRAYSNLDLFRDSILVHGFIPAYIQFTLVGWGFGLIFHGLNAFEMVNFFGPAWERKKVEKRLGRKL
jgi:hypothetical protein